MSFYIYSTFSIELTDITIGNLASTARGLSRKRPRRSLNVTAFEKQLQDGDGKIKATTYRLQCFNAIV